jgi:hypothetical protein
MGQYWMIVNLDGRMAVRGVPPPRTSPLDFFIDWGSKQWEIGAEAHMTGSPPWCLAHLLRTRWQGMHMCMVGDYAEDPPFLNAMDRVYLGGRRLYHVAADEMANGAAMVGPIEAFESTEKLPFDRDAPIVLVCHSLRQYVDPRAFCEAGSFRACVSTKWSCLAALIQQISWSNGGGGGDLNPSCGSWAGERVGIWVRDSIDLSGFEDAADRFIDDLKEAQCLDPSFQRAPVPLPSTPPVKDAGAETAGAEDSGEEDSGGGECGAAGGKDADAANGGDDEQAVESAEKEDGGQ